MRVVLFLIAFFIAGCQSEVDKCVDSQVRAWKVREARKQEQIREYEKTTGNRIEQDKNSHGFSLAEALDLIPTLDKRSEPEVEAEERKRCMRISSGK